MMLTRSKLSALVVGVVIGMFVAWPALAAVEISFYYSVSVGGPIAQTYDKLVADFNQSHPNIRVKSVYSGNQVDTLIKVQTAIRGGTPPAIALLDTVNVYTLIDDDMVVPVSDFIKDEDRGMLEDLFPAFLARSKVGGKSGPLPLSGR